ncbi:MAG: ribonuclease HI [Treponema sp.]|jgi:ribonuclease HI|nr:ribonuclease HI [Treponema sp.]
MALDIYTDGGCSGHPGPGGWAWVMVQTTFQGEAVLAEDSGSRPDTTNNRMELEAVISALKAFRALQARAAPAGLRQSGSSGTPPAAGPGIPRTAVVHTDSQYVQKGITGWIIAWKRNSWRTSDKKPVKNQDLWKELDDLAGSLDLRWEWVRGHAGNPWNERCDRMTGEAIRELKG